MPAPRCPLPRRFPKRWMEGRCHVRAQLAAVTAVLCLLAALAVAHCQDNELKSFGSGFVVDPRGYVLTNEHVIHRAKSVKVILREKETLPATILSADADHDLALLKVDSPTPLHSIPIGNSSTVARQHPVLAMGFPFGEGAVTSTSGRIVSIRKEGANQVLVTDAVVNPGNSGGPLLNDRGEAIGVVSSLLMADVGDTRVKAGEVYAIPISFALPLLGAVPGFDWTRIGSATARLEPDQLDAISSPAVVQILSDSVAEGTISGAAGEGESDFNKNAVALLSGYLDRMGRGYEVEEDDKYPVISLDPIRVEHATHRLRIVTDAEKQLVYLFINRYISVPEDHPRLAEIQRRLMELNWDLNIGKFEWDKSDGETRLSYCFTTENGVGFEAFEAIVITLLKTADDLWPELSAMAKR